MEINRCECMLAVKKDRKWSIHKTGPGSLVSTQRKNWNAGRRGWCFSPSVFILTSSPWAISVLEKVWIGITDVRIQLSDKHPRGLLHLPWPILHWNHLRDSLLYNMHKLQAMSNPYEGKKIRLWDSKSLQQTVIQDYRLAKEGFWYKSSISVFLAALWHTWIYFLLWAACGPSQASCHTLAKRICCMRPLWIRWQAWEGKGKCIFMCSTSSRDKNREKNPQKQAYKTKKQRNFEE